MHTDRQACYRALLTGGGRPTPAQLLAQSQAFRPWRAYAALHLWAAGASPARQGERRGTVA